MKHHPSSIVLSSISKVANKCLFSQWAVHFISGSGIRSSLFSPLCKCPSLPLHLFLSLTVPNSFFLAVCLSARDYRWWWGEEGRWQISGGRPAGPSVCRQKIEFICEIQMLMLSSLCLCLCVCVAQSEERIGRWAGGRGVWWWRRRWRWGLAYIR